METNRLDEKAIFDVARRIDSPDARGAYLRQVCGDDHPLLDRIAAMACIHDEQGSFLEPPPGGVAATLDMSSMAERPGAMVGRYKLLQEIGEGGMGVVYMAEQREPVRRKVALKIIKPGMDSRAVIGRFEAERQALALMDHPNIARVLDGGATESGRPFFVMELVHGVPITEYCDQHELATDQRLELFVSVCQAVQHAHQKGIIHRDLKPSNVLVTLLDGSPLVKVIDFGVAKATNRELTDKTVFTGFGQMIGTPLYMSPEQAEMSAADVDTRSDIYSLGVLLYELLTGETPFDKERLREANYDEIRRVIREEEPPRPSTRISTLGQAATTISARRQTDPAKLSHALRGELDWIVMKALEKDRSRRYETATGFARDIERYLNDEPVEACPPSAVYRFGKFARRNKTALVLTGAVALAVTLGAGVAVWQSVRATRESLRATEALRGEERQLERAEANLGLALEALDDVYLKSIGEDRLLNIATGDLFDPKQTSQREPFSESERKLIQQGLRFYDQFARQNADSPQTLFEAGKAYGRVALLQVGLDQNEEAQASYEQSIRRLKQLAEQNPTNAEYFLELGTAYYQQGLLNRWRPNAKETFAKALAAFTRAIELDPRDPRVYVSRATLHLLSQNRQNAVSDYEKAAKLSPRDAYIHRTLARTIWLGGASPAELTRALDHGREAARLDPDHADTHRVLADIYFKLQDVKSAAAEYESAIKLSAGDPQRQLFLRVAMFSNLGDHRQVIEHAKQYFDLQHRRKNTYEEKKVLLLRAFSYEALEENDKALADLDAFDGLDPNEAQSYKHRGAIRHKQGRYADAAEEYGKAIELWPRDSYLYVCRAESLLRLGQYDDALADLGKAIELSAGTSSVRARRIRAESYLTLGRYDEALADLDKAIELLPGTSYIYVRRLRAESYLTLGRYGDALADLDKLIELSPGSWFLYKLRAATYFRLERYDDALADLAKAVELRPDDCSNLLWISLPEAAKCSHERFRPGLLELADKTIKLTHEAARAYATRGRILAAFGEEDKALIDLRTAVDRMPVDNKAKELSLTSTCYGVGVLCAELAHRDEALQSLVGAIDRVTTAAAEHPDEPDFLKPLAGLYSVLASVHSMRGNAAEAIDAYRKGFEADPKNSLLCNNAAWMLATDADVGVRDPQKAIELAKKACELSPNQAGYWNTLGVAHYRAESYQEAVAALQKSIDLGKGGNAVDWLFHAMAHWRLDQKDEARQWYDKAVTWMDEKQSQDEELLRFRAEAAELLGIVAEKVKAEKKPKDDGAEPGKSPGTGRKDATEADQAKPASPPP